MTYEEEYQIQCDLLDKLDLLPFLNYDSTIGEIMDSIQNAYDDHEFPDWVDEIVEAEPLKGYIQNLMCEDDFMDYLEHRYGTRFREHTTYYITRIQRDGRDNPHT